MQEAAQAVLAIAFSYPVDEADLKTTFSYRVVRLTLDGMSSDAHWSKQKQNRLAQKFLEVVKQLSAQGIRRIHLVMAAPNSVVFTFGRRYDKRNLPEIVVYQYDRGKSPAYPWGVVMPVSGVERPSVAFEIRRHFGIYLLGPDVIFLPESRLSQNFANQRSTQAPARTRALVRLQKHFREFPSVVEATLRVHYVGEPVENRYCQQVALLRRRHEPRMARKNSPKKAFRFQQPALQLEYLS